MRTLTLWRTPSLVLAAGVAITLAYPFVPLHVQEALYLLAGAGACAASARRARRRKALDTVEWRLLAAGLALFVVGDALWYGYSWLGGATPFPSAADPAYLAGYAVLAAGVLVAWRRDGPRPGRDGIDLAIVGLAVTAAVFLVLIAPQFDGGGIGLVEITSSAYPLMDALLLIAFAGRALHGARAGRTRLVVAGLALMLVADVMYAHSLLHGNYMSGLSLDIGWMLSYACLTAAPFVPSLPTGALPARSVSAGGGGVLVRAAMLAAAIALSFASIATVGPSTTDDRVVIALTSAVMVLVFVRLAILLRDQRSIERLLRTDKARLESIEAAQRELAGAGLSVATTTRVSLERTEALAGADGAAVFVLEAPGRLTPWQGHGILSPAIAPTLDRNASLGGIALERDETVLSIDTAADRRVDASAARATGARSLIAVPLHFAGAQVGVLMVGSLRPRAFDHVEVRSVELMASLLSVALSRSAEFAASQALATIVDASPDAVVGTDLEGTIRSWSAGATTMYGYTPAEAIGGHVSMLSGPEDGNEVDGIRARALGGEYVHDVETERVTRDGRRLVVSLSITPVRDTFGRLVGLSCVHRDITARRALEEELHEARKLQAIGRLAGGIAHDFNNILLVIRGYSSLLEEQLHGTPAGADAREIGDAAERAARLVSQLLAFGRRQVLQPTRIDLNEAIRDVTSLLDRVIGEHIDVVVVPDTQEVPVDADRTQIEQLLVNLALNARDAMPAGGTLTLAARCDHASGTATLTVADTGTGIDPDVLPHVFEPFFTTKPQGSGSGLGLASVHGIVNQSGGRIDVDSTAGRGATFTIRLPLAAAAAAPLPAPADAGGAALRSGRGETILLVEDEDAVRGLVARALEEHGYRVLASGLPREALVRAEQGDVDLLVTDLVMPGLKGTTLARQLRVTHPDLPVILISGFSAEAVEGETSEFTLLGKPFTPEVLARLVRTELDGSRSLRAA
jgi:PAS domain S-box-containing protein